MYAFHRPQVITIDEKPSAWMHRNSCIESANTVSRSSKVSFGSSYRWLFCIFLNCVNCVHYHHHSMGLSETIVVLRPATSGQNTNKIITLRILQSKFFCPGFILAATNFCFAQNISFSGRESVTTASFFNNYFTTQIKRY